MPRDNPSAQRRSHAYCDHASRRIKAEKIARILEQRRPLHGLRILEIGTGSGVIAAYLAELAGENGKVTAVDTSDQRIIDGHFRFLMVKDCILPFSDDSFDVVVSNQVLEHVGDRPEQLRHLREIGRVLRPDGIGYLAVPNRWSIQEYHYRLPFLSWLPRPLANLYLRATRKGYFYDCFPPGPLALRRWMRASGLVWQTASSQALTLFVDTEGGSMMARLAAHAPAELIDRLSIFMPTMIFLIGIADAETPAE